MITLMIYATLTLFNDLVEPYEWDVVMYERNARNSSVNPSDFGFIEGIGIRNYHGGNNA